MTQMVQLVVAGDIGEAEAIRRSLASAGIAADIAPAVDHGADVSGDVPQKILVPESSLEAAQDALAAIGEQEDDRLDG